MPLRCRALTPAQVVVAGAISGRLALQLQHVGHGQQVRLARRKQSRILFITNGAVTKLPSSTSCRLRVMIPPERFAKAERLILTALAPDQIGVAIATFHRASVFFQRRRVPPYLGGNVSDTEGSKAPGDTRSMHEFNALYNCVHRSGDTLKID
jgi:hypothetical protein